MRSPIRIVGSSSQREIIDMIQASPIIDHTFYQHDLAEPCVIATLSHLFPDRQFHSLLCLPVPPIAYCPIPAASSHPPWLPPPLRWPTGTQRIGTPRPCKGTTIMCGAYSVSCRPENIL